MGHVCVCVCVCVDTGMKDVLYLHVRAPGSQTWPNTGQSTYLFVLVAAVLHAQASANLHARTHEHANTANPQYKSQAEVLAGCTEESTTLDLWMNPGTADKEGAYTNTGCVCCTCVCACVCTRTRMCVHVYWRASTRMCESMHLWALCSCREGHGQEGIDGSFSRLLRQGVPRPVAHTVQRHMQG